MVDCWKGYAGSTFCSVYVFFRLRSMILSYFFSTFLNPVLFSWMYERSSQMLT